MNTMVHCCIQGCKNTHHNKGKKDEWGKEDSRNYSLHDLPSEERMDIRELWVMAIHRASLPKDVAVCSDHFTEDCFDEKWEEYKRKYGPTKVGLLSVSGKVLTIISLEQIHER